MDRYDEHRRIESAEATSTVASAHNAFGLRLFQILCAKSLENVFVSPTSIALALSMAANGAGGETQMAMLRTLELDAFTQEEMSEASSSLIALLSDMGSKVELSIANSLWMRDAGCIRQEYQESTAKDFQAELRDLEGAPNTINQWVRQKTRGRIDKIVDREAVEGATAAILVNAIYFLGKWTLPFEPYHTCTESFSPLHKPKRPCRMMVQDGTYDYLQDDAFQAIRLPYGYGRTHMCVLLPANGVPLDEFLAGLTLQRWRAAQPRFQRLEGTIHLPRFRSEYETELSPVLIRMGMETAFSPQKADFSRMLSDSHGYAYFCLEAVIHKTFVEVKEEGTEAAAVTAIVAAGCAAPDEPVERFEMIVDRPFVCAIVDSSTDALLFLGAITDPQDPK